MTVAFFAKKSVKVPKRLPWVHQDNVLSVAECVVIEKRIRDPRQPRIPILALINHFADGSVDVQSDIVVTFVIDRRK